MATIPQDIPDSAVPPYQADDSRVCSACGTAVARQDCHKNRYSEYICHHCQRDGILFTRGAQLRHYLQFSFARALLFLAGVGLVLLAAWALYKYLE